MLWRPKDRSVREVWSMGHSSELATWRIRLAQRLLREPNPSVDDNRESDHPDEDRATSAEDEVSNNPSTTLIEFTKANAGAVLFAFSALIAWVIEQAHSESYCDYFGLPTEICGSDLRDIAVVLIALLATVGFLIAISIPIYYSRWRTTVIIVGILLTGAILFPGRLGVLRSLLLSMLIIAPILIVQR